MPIRLDERLSEIAHLIRCNTVADIGCDHGKLSYYLLQTDRAQKVIATDISAKSLEKAEKLAVENGVEDCLITRLGDGLAPIKSEEADVVVIAGLGGDVISEIVLKSFDDGKKFSSFILSPNTHPEKVRRALEKVGHNIVSDNLTECGKKYYTIIQSCFCAPDTREKLDDKQILFGKFYKTDKVFKEYAERTLRDAETLLESHYSVSLDEKAEILASALKDCENENS